MNKCTPKEKCSVRYNNLDTAIKQCILVSEQAEICNIDRRRVIFSGKTDFSSAFRVLPLRKDCFQWLVLMAEDPKDGKFKFFIDKCLPFGASISCSHYQRFSNALRHILEYKTQQKTITNYLDDFLFIAYLRLLCNSMIQQFINLYTELRIPITVDKTVWAGTQIVFLGILLDSERLMLSLPLEKQEKALKLLNEFMDRKKATIHQIQVLTGYLNFLTKAIAPGITFTRRMYAKATLYEKGTCNAKPLKPYHHVRIDAEFPFDCEVW